MGLETSSPQRWLDIGGGTDPAISDFNELNAAVAQDETVRTTERQSVHALRAVRLAQEHPDTQHFVIDPRISTALASEVHAEVPNVHFVVDAVTDERHLPFPDASFDTVELNFMFYPLSDISEHSGEGEDTYETFVYGSMWEGMDQVALYIQALSEASRVLKPGGKLFITEKRSRMEKLVDIIHVIGYFPEMCLDRQLGLQPNIIKHLIGYEKVKLQKIEDPDLTYYTKDASTQKAIFLAQDEYAEAEAVEPVMLTLEKINSRLSKKEFLHQLEHFMFWYFFHLVDEEAEPDKIIETIPKNVTRYSGYLSERDLEKWIKKFKRQLRSKRHFAIRRVTKEELETALDAPHADG